MTSISRKVLHGNDTGAKESKTNPTKNGKTRPVNGPADLATDNRFVRKRVSSLKPSPENQTLYRSTDPNDSELIKLADSIKKHGCVPLVVTLDNYIVSGHRRHAALTRNGQTTVYCRVLQVRRDAMTTDEYVALLRAFNHQRHKSVAEQVREEMVDINPEEAYSALCELRNKSVYAPEHNGVAMLAIEGTKTRHGISDQKADHVKYIDQVVFKDRKDYWPLSVRGVHYALLNYEFMRNIPRKIPYKNDDDSYNATSDLITRLRLDGSIQWDAFEDGTRPLEVFNAFQDVREFARQAVDGIFEGYWRDLLQTQPNHIEVLCEKNTIYHMVLRITRKYQIPTSSGRGFNSIDPYHDLYERYAANGKQRLIVIVLSDFDPEGEQIPQVCGRTLRDDFGVYADWLDIIKAGVTREQIETYKLPAQNFAKESSSNHQWFVDRNGGDDKVYELEALEPANMLNDLEKVIKSVIDIDLFNREVATEQEEAVYLAALQKTTMDRLKGIGE